jgi:excisionase family DNA binding protein
MARNHVVTGSQRYLATSTIARWLGVSPRTVRLWAECGEIPAVKIGRQWRFQETVVCIWMQTKADTSPSRDEHPPTDIFRR